MEFDDIDADTCPYHAAMDVADNIRSHVMELYQKQAARSSELESGLTNSVLAGLTIVWIEAVHSSWNTMFSESAMAVLRGMSPEDKQTRREMKRAARDFLRRSGWWVSRSK
jgi:hypothetical protein